MIDIANIRAIILDFDGLLVDTTLYSYKEWSGIFELYGCTITEDEYAELLDRDTEQMLDLIEGNSGICIPEQTRHSLSTTRRMNIDAAVKKNGLKPGVTALLLACKKAGLPVAIASNTPAGYLSARTRALGITTKHGSFCWDSRIYSRRRTTGDESKHIAALIGTDDHHAPKPAPDILLTAAQHLGIHPAHCLAVDNSPEHAAAAAAAGVPAALIPDAITRHLPAGDITTLSSLYALATLIDERPAVETAEPGGDLPNPFDDIPTERPPGTLPPPPKRFKRRII